jgi:hypothetical protein
MATGISVRYETLGPDSWDLILTTASLACEPAPSSKTRVLCKHQVIADTVKRTQHQTDRQRDWFYQSQGWVWCVVFYLSVK